jgi:hypothetical protein
MGKAGRRFVAIRPNLARLPTAPMVIPSPCLPTISLTTALFAGKSPCFGDLSNILRESKFIRARLKPQIEGFTGSRL